MGWALVLEILPSYHTSLPLYIEMYEVFFRSYVVLFMLSTVTGNLFKTANCARRVCIPSNYSKFELPETLTTVYLKIFILDIPKVDDNNFSITLSMYLELLWMDPRVIIDRQTIFNSAGIIPVDKSFIEELWKPDIEIRHLKAFETQDIISKQEGIWLDTNFDFWYMIAARITINCPMVFNNFPFDIQICHFQVIKKSQQTVFFRSLFINVMNLFQVGSFSYDDTRMKFRGKSVSLEISSILDYIVSIGELPEHKQTLNYTGRNITHTIGFLGQVH